MEGNAQISFRNAKVYQGEKAILNLVPVQKEHTGILLQSIKGETLLTIYEGNVGRGEEKGYVVKFADDNKYYMLFRKPTDDLFFKNIIEEVVTSGAITESGINAEGKNGFLKKHHSSGDVVEPGDLINY